MSPTPLVSVCVPTYNYARFLPDCIESVLAQNLQDWELVISDDCSTDMTAEIVQEYAEQDSRIRYFRNEQRLGMNGNIKMAAGLGQGKYLKMLCADDWMAPDCLATMCASMEQNSSAVLGTSAEILSNENGEPICVQFLFGQPVLLISGEKMLDRMAWGEGFGGHSSFFIRRSAYELVGAYDDTLLYAADMDLAARLCRIGDYIHVDAPLFYGRVQPDSSSTVNPGKLWDVVDAFAIPDKIFRPRRFPNREWRRYHLLTAKLTARYLTNFALQKFRGQHEYASKLRVVLKQHGNFMFGVPLLLAHLPSRVVRRFTGRRNPTSMAPPANAGSPSALHRLQSRTEVQ